MLYIGSMEQITHSEFEKYGVGKYATWLADMHDFYIALNPESEAARQAEQLLEGSCNAAREKCNALNACFVVLIQPAESDIAESGSVSHVDLARYSEA